MRSEKEMYQLLLEIANTDDRILAVYMNGSRTNVNVPKDIFQDYDVVYVVRKTRPFIEDKNWIRKFGDILYMQYPDESPDEPSDRENIYGWLMQFDDGNRIDLHLYMQYPDESPDEPSDRENIYGWLMQFDDGNRIDLHVESIAHAKEHIYDDKLCKILLDKEQILPKIPEATDEDYHVKRPSEAQFQACANEFWWCTNNLAKGLWREEMPYVQDMANFVVRKQLEKMLSWKVGIKTDFHVSVGKSAKYLYKWLNAEEYQRYLDTYFGGNIAEAWAAVFRMCDLFALTARDVACMLGYAYNAKEGEAARSFLEHVRDLPKKKM